MLADEGVEGVAAAVEGGLFAAELVAFAAAGGFVLAGLVELSAVVGELGFEALEARGDVFKGELDLAAFEAEGGEFLAGVVGFGEEAFGFAVEAGEGGCGLGLFVAGLGDALDELEEVAAVLLGLLLGEGEGADAILGESVEALGFGAGLGGFGAGGFGEGAVVFEVSGEVGELGAGGGEVVGALGEAGGEFGGAVGVGGDAGGDAFELDGGLVGGGVGLADLGVKGVAVADSLGVLCVHGLERGCLGVDGLAEGGDARGWCAWSVSSWVRRLATTTRRRVRSSSRIWA